MRIFAVGLNSAGVTVGAAVRTPPNKLLATGFEDAADATVPCSTRGSS